MNDFRGHENIDDARKRLYDRTNAQEQVERHGLSEQKVDVTRNWQNPVANTESQSTPTPPAPIAKPELAATPKDTKVATSFDELKPKRHYRLFVLIGSLLIFILIAGFSSMYLYFGGNQISSENIGINISGPASVGGGEVMSLQVAVTNQNTVAIESATLIVKYPPGTRSATELDKTILEDRIPINGIEPGEVRNIPVRVAIFGEESNQREIKATIEYRIAGSNGMFYKDSAPFIFTISSSPLVLSVENIEKVASGQLVELTITARSNASNPLNDVLISAQYPNGFTYESSSPQPIFGKNVWRIDQLDPEESFDIKLKGVVSGLTDETFRINFEAGPAQSDNQYIVASQLAQARADFTIERPFIGIDISIAGDNSDTVNLPADEKAKVRVNITNTLDETVYDMAVEVVPGGNALDIDSISSQSGFYDSNSGTVRWEVANTPDFAQVFPGDRRTLEFDIVPGAVKTTASFDLTVNIFARRVAETSAAEQLIGTVKKEGKYSSKILVGGQAGLINGPVPPQVGQTTIYSVTLVAEAGANDVTDGIINTSLPLYINWLNQYQGDGELTYNNVSKQIEWRVGDIDAGRRKQITMQVSIQPSISQVATKPVLVNNQKMRANDRFTGVLLQATAPAIITELSTELGYERDNGVVQN